MPDRKLAKTAETQTHLSRQAEEGRTGALQTTGISLPDHNPLAGVISGAGNEATAVVHAAALDRATGGHPAGAGRSLLQLQRQYGNRYVRRVVALAKKGDGQGEVTPGVEEGIKNARGGGQTLDSGVRTQMESAFGADFGRIRVHTGAQADTLSRSLQARAFTTGQDIFFREGAYNPGSSSGRELLAHEMTHVVQQGNGQVRAKLTLGQVGDKYEREADQVARAIIRQEGRPAATPVKQGTVRRQAAADEDQEGKSLQTKSQAPGLQRQETATTEEGEEETTSAQAKAEMTSIQRQPEEGEEEEPTPAQAKAESGWLQRQDAGEEEGEEETTSAQAKAEMTSIQRQPEEGEEEEPTPARAKAESGWLQRQDAGEEEGEEETTSAQAKAEMTSIQRQAEEGEEEEPTPAQAKAEGGWLQRQEIGATEEGEEETTPVQAKAEPTLIQRREIAPAAVPMLVADAGAATEAAAGIDTGADRESTVEPVTEVAVPTDRAGTEATKRTGPAVGEEGEEAAAEEGEEEPADSDAEGERRLESVMENLSGLAQQQQGVAASRSKARATAKKKAVAASRAAPSPKNEAAAQGKGAQIAVMDKQDKGKVEKGSFLDLVKEKLRAMDMPKNPKQMGEFKQRGGASVLKEDVVRGAKEQQAKAQGAIAAASAATPKPAAERTPAELSEPGRPPRPRGIKSEDVLPPPKSEAEVSLEKGRGEVAGELAKENLTKDRLVKANDPRFSAAQESREAVDKHAAEGPKEYRAAEGEILASEMAAVKATEKGLAARMHSARKGADGAVLGKQQEQMSDEEKARKKIADDLEAIYAETKKTVDDKLKWLDEQVDTRFTRVEQRARQSFEDFVADEFDRWKDRRYSGLSGKWTWIEDRFRDINELPAVRKIYEDGQKVYFDEIERGINGIGQLIDDTLTWTKKQIIEEGRKRVQTYLSNLDGDLKKLGAEAGKEVLDKFSDLKDKVDDHRDALADKLVQRYQESREKLNARIEEIKDANRSLVIKAKRKIEAVIEAIKKFRDRLMSLLSRVRDVVEQILDDPIGFLKNLLRAVKKGVNQFKDNFVEHLKVGIFGWLFGTFAAMGIQLPKDFSIKSVVGFILQILGITWDRIRSKAVRLIGERNVAIIEKVVGYLTTLFTEGPAGLWEEIKEDLSDLKDRVIEAIKDWLITRIVKAAITKLVSMFNPVGAIVQAVLTIYNVVMFLVERIDQILQLVETVINSLASIVAGQIDAAANFVERAMAQTLPVIISFLARLIGLGGIAERVKKIITKVRRRVDRAIDKALRKIVARIKALLGRGKAAAKKVVAGLVEWWKAKQKFKTSDGATHTLFFRGKGKSAALVVASKTETVEQFIEIRKDELNRMGKLKRARQIKDQLRTITRKDVDRTEAEQITKLLSELSNIFIRLGGGTLADLPKEARWYGRSNMDLLSTKTSKIVSDRATAPVKGYGLLQRLGLTAAGPRWVKMHMISHRVGGPDKSNNLIPAPNSVNTGAQVRGFEVAVENLVEKRSDNKPNVIWINNRIASYHPARTQKPQYDARTFVEKLTMRAGLYFFRGGKGDQAWVRDKTPRIAETVTIRAPDVTKGSVPSLSHASKTALSKIEGYEHVFTRTTVDRIKEAAGSSGFSNQSDFENRIRKVAPENTKWQDKVEEVIRAVDKLLNAERIKVK